MLNNFPWIWWGIDASLLLNVERKDDDLRHLVAASWSDLGKGSEIIYISSALGAPQDPSMRRSCWIQGCLILVSYGMQGNPDNSPAQYLRLKTSTDICNADFITNLTNSLNLVLKGNGNRQGFGPKHSVVMFWINHSHRLPLQWKHTLSPTLSGGLTGSSWQCWGGGGDSCPFHLMLPTSKSGSWKRAENDKHKWAVNYCDIVWYMHMYIHTLYYQRRPSVEYKDLLVLCGLPESWIPHWVKFLCQFGFLIFIHSSVQGSEICKHKEMVHACIWSLNRADISQFSSG